MGERGKVDVHYFVSTYFLFIIGSTCTSNIKLYTRGTRGTVVLRKRERFETPRESQKTFFLAIPLE